jgi:hypothetical protein
MPGAGKESTYFQTKDDLSNRLIGIFRERTPYALLLGAGFSTSAGIPTAREIVSILGAYKINLLNRKPASFEESIQRYYSDEIDEAHVIEELISRDPKMEGLDHSQIYQELFSDYRDIFPGGRRSQALFIDSLLRAAEKHRYGWNFEGAYLGHLCTHLRDQHDSFIDTILTTNFDNVLPTSFGLTNTRFRLLDHPAAISDENIHTPYPRLTYLHGRYVNYQMINSREDIAALLKEVKNPKHDEQTSLRFRALRSSVSTAAQNGGLFVIGYDGWEDAIVRLIELELKHEGRFEPGVIWCLYGDRTRLRPNIKRLAQRYPRFKIVENVSAIEVMKMILEAAGISEAEVIQAIQQGAYVRDEDLRRRWIYLQHVSRAWPKEEAITHTRPTGISLDRVRHDCEQAFLDPRYSSLSFALIDAVLQNAAALTREEIAVVLQYRGELSLRYSAEVSRAIADFHAVIGLSKSLSGRALAGLSEAYRRLGKPKSSHHALYHAYLFARRSKDSLLLARCRLLHAYRKYDLNKLDNAHRIAALAAATFESHGRFDLSALAYALQAGMFSFNSEGNIGLGFAERALSSAIKGGSRFGEARAKHARGFCYLSLGDFPSAAAALKDARRLALEGPDYLLLSEVNVLLADDHFVNKDVKGAIDLLEEAVEIAKLLSVNRALLQALVWRDLYRLHLTQEPDLENINAAFDSIAQYEQLGDLAVSATQWAVLAWDLISFNNRQDLDEQIVSAIRNCRNKAREFATQENNDKDLERITHGEVEAKSFDAQLTAHVEEHATAVNLLYGLVILAPDLTPAERKKLMANYREFQKNFEVYGFASPRTEVIMAIVSHLLKKHGLLGDGELVKYRGDMGNAQFEATHVREFCNKKGFWWYAKLVS